MEGIKKYVGPISFYRKVCFLGIPLAIQQLITSCMGIVDSMMVAKIGQVSAVGTAVQIESICSSVAWACAAGVGIFSVQFYGANDKENLKKSFGFSLILESIVGLLFFILVSVFGREMLHFYIHDEKIIESGVAYLHIVKYSYVFLALEHLFNITYRNINKPNVPLVMGVIALACKFVLNDCLIFGKYGFPMLGVDGAAYSSVISHLMMIIGLIIYSYKTKAVFVGTIKEMFVYNYNFVKTIIKETIVIVLNELLFGFGSTLFVKAFGLLGTQAIDAYYVGAKISEVFFALANGFSNAIAAILGMTLGVGDLNRAKKEGNYLIGMAIVLSVSCMGLIFLTSKQLVGIFELTNIRTINLANQVVQAFSIKIALRFFVVIVFSSLRAGGDLKILSILDSGLMWVLGIPLAFLSVSLFQIDNIAQVLLICQLEQVLRVILGIFRYQSGQWAVNLTTTIS